MKAYIAPSTTVVRVHLESQLMQASKVGSVSTNLTGGDAIGYVTDTGIVTPEAHEALQRVRVLAIESNHDVKMLQEGPYPYPLKQRILGSGGHLSNAQCCEEVASLLHPVLQHVAAMHVSEHNNTFALPARELEETLAARGHGARVHVARPDRPIAIR